MRLSTCTFEASRHESFLPSLHRGEKKTICNKAVLQSAVTCLVWSFQQPSFVFGQAEPDGKASTRGSAGLPCAYMYV